jgi:ABC-2 type transport system ATP-binding protein
MLRPSEGGPGMATRPMRRPAPGGDLGAMIATPERGTRQGSRACAADSRPRTTPPAIEVAGLSKRFGKAVAVQDLSFTVSYGRITGFLGPNGAGKTTTLRALLGLLTPDAGTARIAGRRYTELSDPVGTVGALLDAGAVHPGRTGRDHLRVLATAAGVRGSRADELLATVGLAHAARRRTGSYSLGMRQRLGLAAALLGDPRVLVLDEPANGLDPQGIRWLRDLLRSLAAEGRSILVSSHLLAEVAQTVDDIVVISGGRSVVQAPLRQLLGRHGSSLEDVYLDLTGGPS